MKFSDMKLQAMNAVKSYFKRNWTRQDMMNSGRIPLHSHRCLNKVCFTFFYAMFLSTVESYLHLFWEVGGLFTVLSSVASLFWLCFTSPLKVTMRVSLLMIAAFFFGASVGLITKYIFEISQVLVANLLAGTTIGIGIFSFGALLTRERRAIYIACLLYSCVLIFYCVVVNVFYIIDSHTAYSMFKVIAVVTLFLGYFVLYSQEILYDAARIGDINFVNRTLTIFFRLPAIVVHTARLCLCAKPEQRRRHKISCGVE